MSLFRYLAVCATFALCCGHAGARQHRDVHLVVESGALTTAVIDFEQPGDPVVPGVRLFTSAFAESSGVTDDPGFNSSPGAFAEGTLVGFDILDALRRWDGSDFDQIAGLPMTILLGAQSRVTPSTAGTFVGGFNFVRAGAAGSFHQHVNYILDESSAAGLYLLTLRVRVSAGAEPSAPFYVLFNQQASASEAQSAAQYVTAVLLAPPLCPGDANRDGGVTFADITSVLLNFNDSGPPGSQGDADGDGTVVFADITSVLLNFNQTCP